MVSKSQFLYPLLIGDEVNFRLTYDGPLKAASQSDTRRQEKHAIRCVFNHQLRQLIEVKDHVLYKEMLGFLDTKKYPAGTAPRDVIARKIGGFYFLALVRSKLNLVCDLDILFLRRDDPGQLISAGGDLDNRIKTLFDALRIPQDENEIRGFTSPDENTFMCLTEDDRLITGFRVTTDRLLEPAKSEQEENHVRLIINVEIKATILTEENMAYFSHF